MDRDELDAPDLQPHQLADLVLAAALRAQAEAVYFEPQPSGDYAIVLERDHRSLSSTTVDAAAGAATVARLGFMAGIDLAAASPTSGVIKVRSGDRVGDVVVTLRPGAELGCDLMVILRDKGRIAPAALGRVGDIVGNYHLVEKLGEGGMGAVFRATHVTLGRLFALKILHPRVFERDPTAGQRFLREARAAARIHHPNIGEVFDFGYLADGRPYFVMELLDGKSLASYAAHEPQPAARVVAIARQLASALIAVHDRGVVHGDVTPSNILVVASEPITVKLIDFGLAAIVDEAAFEEATDFVLGTPAYVSPEQLRGLPATDRSDQYSLGAVLFELIAGRPPFETTEGLRALCMLHLEAPIPPLTSPLGPLPPRLAEVITTCLQKTPQQRFPVMRAMLAALDDIERVAERRGWRRWLGT